VVCLNVCTTASVLALQEDKAKMPMANTTKNLIFIFLDLLFLDFIIIDFIILIN
jgi:hypothetical protein